MPARKKSQNTLTKKCKPAAKKPAGKKPAKKKPASKKALAKAPAADPAPKLDREAMVNQAVEWILGGQTEADIREAIAENFPAAIANDLIMGAMEQFEKSAHFARDVTIGFCFQATRDLYRRMVEIADYPAALRAIKQLLEMAEKYGEVADVQ